MDRAEALLQIEVVATVAPRQVSSVRLALPAGSTVSDALVAAGLLAAGSPLPEGATCGVWSRRCDRGRALRDGDRVELYRALTVDPKEARRLRYRGQHKGGRLATTNVGK
jgi:putative ubiquitin-RnfH superfamily antitoxin RatB of RatAB toxin-antitoxin module